MKVCFLIPTRGNVSIEFSISLLHLVNRVGTLGYEPVVVYSRTYGIDHARNDLVKIGLSVGCDKFVFIDDDVIPIIIDGDNFKFDYQAVNKLLKHDKPIVGSLYWNRAGKTLVFKKTPDWVTIDAQPYSGLMCDVDGTGMGLVVIDRKVFEEIDFPWFKYTVDYIGDTRYEFSEDLYFFQKARSAGFDVCIDTDVVLLHETIGYLVSKNKYVLGFGITW